MVIKKRFIHCTAYYVTEYLNKHLYVLFKQANSKPRMKKKKSSDTIAKPRTTFLVLITAVLVMFLKVYLCWVRPKAIRLRIPENPNMMAIMYEEEVSPLANPIIIPHTGLVMKESMRSP